MKLLLLFTFLFSQHSQAELSQAEFRTIADDFVEYIQPVGLEFSPDFVRTVRLDTESSQSDQFGAYSSEPITVLMGTLKSKYISTDGMIIMLCHEVAHDEEFADYYLGSDLEYAFSHLKQDYYAVKVCIKDFIQKNKTYQSISLSEEQLLEIPIHYQTKCQVSFDSGLDQRICLRTIFAGLQLTKALYYQPHMLRHFEGEGVPAPSLDREIVRNTSLDFIQARLMNFANGALGDLPFNN